MSCFSIFCQKRRTRRLPSSHHNEDVPGGPNIKRYTYRELVRATENFSPSNKIGEGGFGSVYKVICITFNREATEVVTNVDVFDIQQLNGAGTA